MPGKGEDITLYVVYELPFDFQGGQATDTTRVQVREIRARATQKGFVIDGQSWLIGGRKRLKRTSSGGVHCIESPSLARTAEEAMERYEAHQQRQLQRAERTRKDAEERLEALRTHREERA